MRVERDLLTNVGRDGCSSKNPVKAVMIDGLKSDTGIKIAIY